MGLALPLQKPNSLLIIREDGVYQRVKALAVILMYYMRKLVHDQIVYYLVGEEHQAIRKQSPFFGLQLPNRFSAEVILMEEGERPMIEP